MPGRSWELALETARASIARSRPYTASHPESGGPNLVERVMEATRQRGPFYTVWQDSWAVNDDLLVEDAWPKVDWAAIPSHVLSCMVMSYGGICGNRICARPVTGVDQVCDVLHRHAGAQDLVSSQGHISRRRNFL